MVAVIKGDIVDSRKLKDQSLWIKPLKELLSSWGAPQKQWVIHSGDFFQIEITHPEDALKNIFEIKALIKKIAAKDPTKKSSVIDVRMALGIGEKTYSANNVSENNGPAYIYSSEKFDVLKKENISIGIKSYWESFDEEINLYLQLTRTFMDKWTISSAEIAQIALNNPSITQQEIGKQLGIKQNSVSGRWNRAYINEILAVEHMYRKKIKYLLQ